VSQLLPDGIDHLSDCPFPLHGAILTALRILNYEEFPPDERPPRAIWLNGEKLTEWWKGVDAAREKRYSTDTDDSDDNAQHNGLDLIARGR
jgi:hypothetical protein